MCEAEARQLDPNRQPRTRDDFERLVFQSPNSSLAWLGFASFCLEQENVETARVVMENALRKIPLTEVQEIRNVWFSYVNLECTYGGTTSLSSLLKRFTEHNDTFAAYNHLIQVFEKCKKLEDAEKIGQLMIHRFKYDAESWTSFGRFLYTVGRLNDARDLLQQSVKYLDKQHSVNAAIQFAKMEFKDGSTEHASLMFEKLLENNPKRTDLWSVYIDAVVKLGDNEQTRELFERVTGLALPAKKMQFIFKKFIEFEEKNGNSQTVDDIRKKAIQFIESSSK